MTVQGTELICAGCGLSSRLEPSVRQRCCRVACNDCHFAGHGSDPMHPVEPTGDVQATIGPDPNWKPGISCASISHDWKNTGGFALAGDTTGPAWQPVQSCRRCGVLRVAGGCGEVTGEK